MWICMKCGNQEQDDSNHLCKQCLTSRQAVKVDLVDCPEFEINEDDKIENIFNKPKQKTETHTPKKFQFIPEIDLSHADKNFIKLKQEVEKIFTQPNKQTKNTPLPSTNNIQYKIFRNKTGMPKQLLQQAEKFLNQLTTAQIITINQTETPQNSTITIWYKQD